MHFTEIFDAVLPRSAIHWCINNNSVIKCYSRFVTLNSMRPITWVNVLCVRCSLFIILFSSVCYFCAQNTYISRRMENIHILVLSRIYIWYACMHTCLCVIECGNQARIDHDHYCLYKAIVALSLAISLKFQCISYSRESVCLSVVDVVPQCLSECFYFHNMIVLSNWPNKCWWAHTTAWRMVFFTFLRTFIFCL